METWETIHNVNFKRDESITFRISAIERGFLPTPQSYIEKTGAIGIISKSGRYGGTYAHEDLALNFCYWLSPVFQAYFIQEFRRMKKQEVLENTTDWALMKAINGADEIRILLETIQELRAGTKSEEE